MLCVYVRRGRCDGAQHAAVARSVTARGGGVVYLAPFVCFLRLNAVKLSANEASGGAANTPDTATYLGGHMSKFIPHCRICKRAYYRYNHPFYRLSLYRGLCFECAFNYESTCIICGRVFSAPDERYTTCFDHPALWIGSTCNKCNRPILIRPTDGERTCVQCEKVYSTPIPSSPGYERFRRRSHVTNAEKKRERGEPRSNAGYVYLLKSAIQYYKIGRAIDPDNRLQTFTVKLPFEVEYEYVIKTKDRYALENELHRRFARKRIRGEWFDLNADDVIYIKSIRDDD